jgi:hypothetical protein
VKKTNFFKSWFDSIASRTVDFAVYTGIFLACVAIGVVFSWEVPVILAVTLIASIILGGPAIDGIKSLFENKQQVHARENAEPAGMNEHTPVPAVRQTVSII